MNYWLIIRLPILFAIGVSVAWGGPGVLGRTGQRVMRRPPATLPSALQVNFLIFVRVICIVVSKLKANVMCKTDIKCRRVAAGAAGHPRPSLRQRRRRLRDLLPAGPRLGPTPCPPPYIWAAPGLWGARPLPPSLQAACPRVLGWKGDWPRCQAWVGGWGTEREKSSRERPRVTSPPTSPPTQTCQVHIDAHPPAGHPRGHLCLRDGRARPGHPALHQAAHRALLHFLPGDHGRALPCEALA